MTCRPTGRLARPRLRLDRLLLTSAAALVLTTSPVGIGTDRPLPSWHAAFAKGKGGGEGGPDGGKGNGRGGHASEHGGGPGPRGHAYGHYVGQGGQNDGASYHDVDEFVDSVRSGRALGLARRDERVDEARGRYQDALGHRGPNDHPVDDIGAAAHHFSPEETEALIARGWKGPTADGTGFRNHGERVRTMVELSKRLGLGAGVGAMQANFGTPFENGIAELQDRLDAAEAESNDLEVRRLENDLADAIRDAKPGEGPAGSWETIEDLDVNGDQVVDRRDLEELERREASADANDEPPAG